jgi:hypothetical protein
MMNGINDELILAARRASGGFTTIVQKNSSPARSFTLLTRIRRINRCLDRPERCLQTGKRCFTNRGGSLVRPQATRSDLGGWPSLVELSRGIHGEPNT